MSPAAGARSAGSIRDVAESPEANWDPLKAIGDELTIPRNAVLLDQNVPTRSVYLLLDGVVRIARAEGPDDEPVTVGLRYPGWLVGATSCLLNEPTVAAFEALVTCRVCQVPATRFLREVAENPRLSLSVHRMLSQEVHNQFRQLSGVGALPARRRLERLLAEFLRMQQPFTPGPVRLNMQFGQADLAAAIMVTPQWLSRLLKDLEAEGWIVRSKGWIVIPEPGRFLTIGAESY